MGSPIPKVHFPIDITHLYILVRKDRELGSSIVLIMLSYLKTYTFAYLKVNFHALQIKSQKRILELDFMKSFFYCLLFRHIWSK